MKFRVLRTVGLALALSITAPLFLSAPASARPLTVEEKLRDLEQIVSMMKSGYGPLEYKKTAFGIDIDRLRADYYLKIQDTTNNLEFYYLLNQFIAEFKDSHYSGRLPTDHRATLGFTTDLVQGKVLIDTIDRKKLPEADFPYQKGDELAAVNGVPTADLIATLSKYIGMGNPDSTRRAAAMAIATRSGSRFPVPAGEVTLEIINQAGDRNTKTSSWFTSGEVLDEDTVLEARDLVPGHEDLESSLLKPHKFKLSSREIMTDFIADFAAESSFQCSGKTRTKIPDGATVIMESPFVAYYHDLPGQPGVKVGYLRIPHYAPDFEDNGPDAYDTRFAQYEYAVSVLEQNTQGLIIDQDHNCGGSVFYLEQMAGLFAADTYPQLQFEFLATKKEYMEFKQWLDEVPQNTLDYHHLKSTVDLLKETWLNGRSFLTTKTGLRGGKTFAPHVVRYTKPILMLIDELSGSGGDAFPSLLQGIGRAKLMGKRTMGAGGHVTPEPALFFSNIAVNMTKSLFYRPDGVPVENNGAEPDFVYEPTKNDFVNGYVDYQRIYLAKIAEMIGAQ